MLMLDPGDFYRLLDFMLQGFYHYALKKSKEVNWSDHSGCKPLGSAEPTAGSTPLIATQTP